MKKLVVMVLLLVLVVPVLPMALGTDTTDVDIGIGADTVNLTVTCTTSTGGTVHINVNGVEITEVTNIYEHNYDDEIIYLNQSIDGVQFNIVALANYTNGRLSMLFVNDNCLVGWMGCLNITNPIGRRISNGSSNVVMELTRLTDNDAVLLGMIKNLGDVTKQLDLKLGTQIAERKVAEEELKGLLARLQSESAMKSDLEITNKNLVTVSNELLETRAQLKQLSLVLMAVGAVVTGLIIAWVVGLLQRWILHHSL